MISATEQLKHVILTEIRRIADSNGGKSPGLQRFEAETGFKKSQWYGSIWARWGDALAEAGLTPNTLTKKAEADWLLRNLADAVRHFGRVPSKGDLRLYAKNIDANFPGHTTMNAAFGSKGETVEQIRMWLECKPEFADVLALLPSATRKLAAPLMRPKTIDGAVYLIRFGKHFKIGRSDQVERRFKEIRVALPETATIEHIIATDDPPGIEAYWHRRFADRRANGEWFALTPKDILVFKRRKLQ